MARTIAKRLALVLALVAGGFVAGVAYTVGLRPLDRPRAGDTVSLMVEDVRADATAEAGEEAGARAVPPAAPAPAPARPAAAEPPAGDLPDFTAVAARSIGAVTNISSQQTARRVSPFADDPFFRHFFGDQEDMFGWRSRPETSLGSGVIVTADGYVLTNSHVVGSGTPEITVTLSDRRELPARLIGVDTWTDIALLKIDAAGLPVLPWGDSDRLRVAEWVLAIGNPFQLDQTVTLGIVSALERRLGGQVARYEDFIQTDAAINPGNSGGALINARGELVGINTAIFSRTGGYQGVGFAVPSNLARRVMKDLTEHGHVRRGSMGGLEIAPVTSQLARQLGAPDTRGAVIWRMRRDSAAFRAGIRPGDVIVRFNGTPVDDAAHFLRLLSDAPIGTTAELDIIREGRSLTVKVPIAQQDPRP